MLAVSEFSVWPRMGNVDCWRFGREFGLVRGLWIVCTGCPKSLFTPFFRRQWPLKGRFQMIFPYIWALPESLEQGALHATHLFSI